MSRARPLVFASLLLCTACPSDDGNDEAAESGSSESGDSTTAAETETETETDTGPSCGVAAGVCCMELEPCEVTEDCCEPETFTCALEGPTYKCLDLAQMCSDCLTNCMADGVPPDVCEMSCMVWCG